MDHQHLVDHRPLAFRSPTTRVIAGHVHRQHVVHESHRELALVTSDQDAPQLDPFARYTARRPRPGPVRLALHANRRP
jgi:hypothetical protein